jgi:hypothetical protein
MKKNPHHGIDSLVGSREMLGCERFFQFSQFGTEIGA